MHIPKIYKISDPEVIEEFIRQNSFATIVSSTGSHPIGTHIPLDLQQNDKGEKVLWGHVSKGNPHWKQFETNPGILAIFMSHIHSYISSSWYKNPNAPTWNYMSVHISGMVSIIEGEKLWESVKKLTDKFEKDSEHPISLDTLPESIQRMMNGIKGFEIKIEKMECAFKLSQNRTEKDLRNIIHQLKLKDDISSKLMAEVMEKKYYLSANRIII